MDPIDTGFRDYVVNIFKSEGRNGIPQKSFLVLLRDNPAQIQTTLADVWGDLGMKYVLSSRKSARSYGAYDVEMLISHMQELFADQIAKLPPAKFVPV